MIQYAHDNGYETTVNIMAVSTVPEHEIQAALEVLAKTPVDVIYLVDSFGSLYSEQIRSMSKMYLDAMEGTGKQLGIHTHNNQALAFANTIEALICGADFLDATIDGIGRGAGNCALELLIGFLHNPKFKMRPVVECLEKQFVPLKKNIEWGPLTPYIITGQLNQHPRAAMKLRDSDSPNEFVKFYDQMLEVE
jgi:4-hydroxy 2-oxovalerate aldolase